MLILGHFRFASFSSFIYDFCMISKYRIITNRILNSLLQIERTQKARLEELKACEGLSLKYDGRPDGGGYYFVSRGSGNGGVRTFQYLGKESNDTVRDVKEFRHLQRSLKALSKDIRLLKLIQSELEDFDRETIDMKLPKTYRHGLLHSNTSVDPRAALWKKEAEARKEAYIAIHGVFHPEELVNPTDDGTMVRSKSEAMIYNLLLRHGITFVYELPLKMKNKARFPDFTLLSEVDYKTVILIEHQGMMDEPEYSDRFNKRVYDYLCNGFISCINIFYTFDGADGSINTNPILDIINLKIRPSVNPN